MSNFEHILIDLNDDGDIVEVGTKTIYNLDDYTPISDWTQELVKKLPKVDFPQLANAIKPEVSKWGEHKTIENALGYFFCHSNNVMASAQYTGLYSGVAKDGHGHGINVDNFLRCCSAFAARRLIKGDWINDKDEYMKPNTDDSRYAEFEADSLVFCLFDSNSQQSSLRKVEYKDKAWDVKNEFFWIPSKTMAEWADAEGLDETYAEASVSPDRHMAKVLNETSLSAEAKAVLDKATELVQKSMKFRQMFNDDHPEYQVLNFDSSYYQLKPIWKEYMPKEFKIFRELVKKLADKMRPAVYSLGFLRK